MPKLLEVIVTSVEEAREAESGGADRLELVRAFEVGGLTPEPEVVEAVVGAVGIPVRVMLRENASLSPPEECELRCMRASARRFAQWPVDGLVLGFAQNGRIDFEMMGQVLADAPGVQVTLHRAFEEAANPAAAIRQAKEFQRIDRILTSGGEGDWEEQKARVVEWQSIAAPEIRILVGVGLCAPVVAQLARQAREFEFHAGRAARVPETTGGAVSREQVAKLKALL
jgi:copper homeostasis protein